MSLAESAVLLRLHPVRMGLLILRHVVITLFAFRTCQCNPCAHDFHLHLSISLLWGLLPCDQSSLRRKINLSIKKRPLFFHSPVYYTIHEKKRQSFFCLFCRKSREWQQKAVLWRGRLFQLLCPIQRVTP